MTIKELYNFCKDNGVENYKIVLHGYVDSHGDEYEYLPNYEDIDIRYDIREVALR